MPDLFAERAYIHQFNKALQPVYQARVSLLYTPYYPFSTGTDSTMPWTVTRIRVKFIAFAELSLNYHKPFDMYISDSGGNIHKLADIGITKPIRILDEDTLDWAWIPLGSRPGMIIEGQASRMGSVEHMPLSGPEIEYIEIESPAPRLETWESQ